MSHVQAEAVLAAETIAQKIEFVVRCNAHLALLIVVDVDAKEVVLRRPREGAAQPCDKTIEVYTNLLTACALDCETAGDDAATTTAGHTGRTDAGVAEEWGVARFRTKHWDVVGYREETGTTPAVAGKRWLLVVFSTPAANAKKGAPGMA